MANEEPQFDTSIIERIEKLFEGITDGTLLILKAHLLLEETLHKEVREHLPNPQHLDKADLNFFRLLCLARALFDNKTGIEKRDRYNALMWDAMEALNTTRNRLAHHLDPKDIPALLARMKVDVKRSPVSLTDPDVVSSLTISLVMMLAFASGLRVAEHVRITRMT